MTKKLPPRKIEDFATEERGQGFSDEEGKFAYFPKTGEMFWLIRGGRKRKDRCAGYVMKGGYIMIEHNGKSISAHRWAWKIMTGSWPEAMIDHINGNPSDNRFCNLRAATQTQNAQNCKKPARNTSGYKGVCWDKGEKKWLAQMSVNGKTKKIGRFDCPEKAHAAYQKATKEQYGEFARFD